ncbi:SRPBCC family protein [Herbidospora sp. RD11066]
MARQTHVEETVDIAVPPDTVYSQIVDVTQIGRFSPECTGATVRGSAGPLKAGDRFTGHNRRQSVRRWSTHCTVDTAEAGREFTFTSAAIGLPIATWSYRLEPLDQGAATRVTEVWDDHRGLFMRVLAVIVSGVRDRAAHNRRTMRLTLRRLKEHLE